MAFKNAKEQSMLTIDRGHTHCPLIFQHYEQQIRVEISMVRVLQCVLARGTIIAHGATS